MSDVKPAPLTTAECDLRGMEWMPLYGHRLFMSDFEARATDPEFRAAMRLWWTAWQQVPAASLPDDDSVLCRLAGLGRDVKAWKRIREGALHGFVVCSDGRIYHRMLATEAKDAWDRRLKERERKAAYRAKKFGTGRGTSADRDGDRDGDKARTGPGLDADVPVDRTRQDKTGQDSTPLPPYDLEGVSLGREDGRPVVNGFYLDGAWDKVARAAAISPDRFRADLRPLVAWLEADIAPETIVAAVERVAARPGYTPPFTLAFFDGAVREQRRVAA